MNNTRVGKKIVTLVVVLALAVCLGICIFLGINASSSGGRLADTTANSFGALNSADGEDTPDLTDYYGLRKFTLNGVTYDITFTYERQKTYKINGKNYKIYNPATPSQKYDGSYIDYFAALRLPDTYESSVSGYVFFDVDGEAGSVSAWGLRGMGLYGIKVNADIPANAYHPEYKTGDIVYVRVIPYQLDYSTTDVIPVFVNANSPDYRAHGDNTALYKHNDGWYSSQKANEVPVEIRPITNSYYYVPENGNPVAIKIGNEILLNGDTSTTSTIPYDVSVPEAERIIINITNRSGVKYSVSNEYIATFTFNAPSDEYEFFYGGAGEYDEITDTQKGLSITERTPTSFILVKHWFLTKYSSLFTSRLVPAELDKDLAEDNNPYVPFHNKQKFDDYLNTTQVWYGDGKNGESDTSTDTITYGDDLHVKSPRAKFTGSKTGDTWFDVIYVDLDGKTHKIANNVLLLRQEYATNTVGTKTEYVKDASENYTYSYDNASVGGVPLDYYFNKSMPAGKYTLKLHGKIDASQLAAGDPNEIKGEYWLTVLPAPLSSSLITGAGGIQEIIRGNLENGEYINSYLLSEKKLHEDLSGKITALNNSLNAGLKDSALSSYWRDLSEAEKAQYFESAVSVKYNRDTWSATNYVTEAEIKQMITQAGNYTLYYSIAAKNYVTTGGPDDANRTTYKFVTRLSQGVSIKEIYDRVYSNDDPYFKNVAYTGEQVYTLVPRSQQYEETFDDEDDYINVRARASVTLTLQGSDVLTGWENDLPKGDLGDRLELSADRQTLTVYFDIVAATNSFTVAPQMSPWTYNSYNKDINFITYGLVFDEAEVYYRIGKKDGKSYEWVNVDGELEVDGEVASEYFAVDENGLVTDAVAEKLNALGAGTYYICGYINPSIEVNGTYNVSGRLMQEQGYSTVVVLKASNEWTTTPYVLDWAYNGFKATNIQTGATKFGNDDTENEIAYTLYEGTDTTGTVKATFNTLTDDISDTLNGLDVSTYTLVASKAGSDDYGPLNLQMTFVVYKATNSWTTTPFINSWAYQHFTSNNVRAGVAHFGEQVTYELREGETADGKLLHTFNSINDTLQIDGQNVVVSDMLTALPAKVYTIVASVADTDNYDGLSMAITFAVTKASNTWTTTPVMTGWAYKLFSTSNFQAGETELGVTSTITYKLYNGNPEDITSDMTPRLEFNSITDDGVIDYFVALEKGTYTLVAHQIGADDYSELSQSMTFSVTQATNTWTTTPYITGWIYKQFTENNFQAGATEFGDSSDITYTLYAGNKAEGDALKTFSSINDDGIIDYFKDLGQGTYTLLAHQDGTESYYALNTPLTFTVSPTTNSWATKPRVIGWVYGSFVDSYFIAGVPTLQESMENGVAAEVKYILAKKAGDSFNVIDTFTQSNLYDFATLGAGTYTLNVSYVGTDNYGKLDADEITFTVSQTGNNWVDGVSPDISGWTYGEFVDGLFTDGAAEHGPITYSVIGSNGNPAAVDGAPLSGMSYADLKAKLNGLNADTYTISATSGSTEDYAAVSWSKQFIVAMANNEWDTAPSINGWTYGGTPATPTNGTAKYENADISGTYYPTTTDGNGNLIADTSKAPLNAVEDAGSYAYVLTVADTTNYNGFTHTLFFTVDKAGNDWTTTPAGSYSWAWGGDIATLTAEVINGTVSFDIVKTGGGYTMPAGKTLAQLLEDLAVGEYTITFTVAVSDNYETVASAIAYVTVGAAQLTVTTEPACDGWTWGVDDDGKVFTDISVTPAKDDDAVTVQYRVSADGGDTWTNYFNTHSTLMSNIKVRPAGDYVVEVTASCANHESVTRTVSFTVAKASLTWSGEPSNVEWEWNDNWTTTAGGRDIPNLTATGCNNVDAALSYTVDGTAYADFTAVKNYLQSNGRNAGVYTVKVSATLANHENDEKTFTVTIKVAENEWINEPDASYEMVYNQWTELPATTAKFGTVVYTCGAETITNVNEWITTRNAQTYVLTLSVAGVTNQYNSLSKEVTIIVKSAGSSWDNQNALSEDNEYTYTAVYGTDEHSALKDTIVFPVRNSGGTTAYSVFVNGGDTADETYTTLAGIQSYFTSDLTAGTYVIKAEFAPTSSSFSKLTYTITVVVEKAEVDWKVKLVQGEPQTYQSVVLTNPEADKDFATVTVTVTNNQGETLDMGGKSLSAFVADLGAGIYTVTATIADSDNYTIVGDQTTTIALYITAIQNAWTDVTEGDTTITAQQWTDGYTWTFTRGDTISVMLPEAVIGAVKISFDGTLTSYTTIAELNAYLNGTDRAARTYSLIFSVDGTDNYTGLVSNCEIVIDKKSNEWTQELQSYTGSGSVDTTEFTLPTADVHQINTVDLRIYNIVKAGARPNSDWYTAEEFLTALGELVNGTYTITARIGGDYRPATADSSFLQALNLYNADYDAMVCSCTVTLSPSENAWTTKLSDLNWTWGDTVSVTLAVADLGNDQIVYTISGSGISTITVKTSECDDIQTALDNAVNGLRPGTYTVTASIVGTDLYAAPTESNVALLTVSKYEASWDTEEDLSEYSLLHMTWNQAANDLLPALSVKCLNGSKQLASGAVVWKIGNYEPDEGIVTALNGFDARTYTVTATYAGDDYNKALTFTATVVIEKVQTTWDAATTAANGKVYYWVLLGANEAVKQPVLETPSWGKTVEYKLQSDGSDLYAGSSWSGLTTELNKCKAGEYTITAHIDGDTNHTALDYSVTINIGQAANGWTAELNGGTWTWGEHATVLNALTKPNADHGNDKIVFTVKNGATTMQTIRVADNDDLDTAFAALKTYLGGLNVGTYTVTVSIAATADYVAPTDTTVVFIVNIVTTTWDAATTANNGKVYNWVLDGANEAVKQPVLGTSAWGKTVEYKLMKGEQEVPIGTGWNGLVTALGNCKAGEYTITAHIDGDTNHTALDYSVTVNISAKNNRWIAQTGNGTSTAKEIEKSYGDDMSFIKFIPEFGTVVVTVNGKETNDVIGYINSNGVREYLIVASVTGNDEYGALVDTVRLNVTQADNKWINDLAISNTWTWNDNANNIVTGLVLPVSEQGDSALVVVTVKQTGAIVLEATINYVRVDGVRKVNDNDFTALNGRLKALNVVSGGYTITVTVGEMNSYKALGGQSADFVINKATNSWATGGEPTISGWNFGGDTAYPSATPVFGKTTVVFTYAAPSDNDKFEDGNRVAPADDAVWQNAPSYQAGSYWLRASVAGTDNYSALVGYYLFTIKEGENKWVNMPGVIAWNWNGYDAAVNLFSGSARSNKPAQFSITKADKSDLDVNDFVAHDSGVVIDVTTIAILKKFMLVENGIVVSDDVAKLLKALKPATYTLTVTVDGGESLESITGSTTFTVGKAANSWATGKAPAVSSYTYGNYNATTTFTYGETVYGDASAVIYKLDDETFTTNASKPAYVQLQERLATLGVGSYTLSAWVTESANGTYSALYSAGSPYTTRTFTVARATNGWTNSTIATQINKEYSEIKKDEFDQTKFAELYAQLTPIDGTVNYALLNSDYTSRNKDALDYAGLFNAIKGLPAGEYVIRATVAETTTTNYLGIGATDTRLIISSHDNAFTQIPDELTAQWARDEDENNATVLTAFEVKAMHGEDTVTYTLNKTTYESYADFEEAVSALNAGSYNVTIAIAATDDYAGLSEVCMLNVTQGQNSWQNDWAASGSLNVEGATTKAGLSWDWMSAVTWTKAVPVYGNTVYVEIRKANASSALQYVTLDYGVSDGASAVATISEAISKLDVGDYELIVSAPATVNWAALSDKVIFSITKVSNSWTKAPQIGGTSGNKWAHGTNAVPDADAKYGDVRYEYETALGDKLTSMPTSAGEYVIKFIVDETVNYDGISGTLNVTIEKATNRTVANLSVIGWTWGSYDREVNVITGTPETAELENAPIKFSIGTGMGDSFAALPDLSEFTLTANGLVERNSKVEAALRALTGGTSKENNLTYYTVRIHVGETTNYNGFTADNRFAVTGASNTFTKYPTIKPWEVNHWTDELPSAVALYGKPEITITGETDGVTYFKGEYKENDEGQLELFVELNELNLAPKGEYVLTASVKAAEGQYNSPLVGEYKFNIDVKGAGQANYWEELPTIDGWIANIDGLFNAPTGKPVRGLPNFVFYVRNADGSRGQKVDASLTNVVLKKGSKYEADIYIPVEHGDYLLVASSKGIPDEEGKSDALAEYEIRVIIDPRPLSFEQELRIPTLLYLGDRKDWADPTSKPSLDDAEITYVYTNKETGVSSTEMPTVAGEYTVTATLSARYSNSVSMSVDFTVKLSPNGWTAAPNIKDWSEESKGNLPTGAATVGTDQIKYTYASVKEPNKILTERPTTEGSYIMYADIDVDGYEPLHAEYRFTIEPAFDTQLVIAAIVLGVFACMLACVVIYFAIKRYKEN